MIENYLDRENNHETEYQHSVPFYLLSLFIILLTIFVALVSQSSLKNERSNLALSSLQQRFSSNLANAEIFNAKHANMPISMTLKISKLQNIWNSKLKPINADNAIVLQVPLNSIFVKNSAQMKNHTANNVLQTLKLLQNNNWNIKISHPMLANMDIVIGRMHNLKNLFDDYNANNIKLNLAVHVDNANMLSLHFDKNNLPKPILKPIIN